MGEEDVASNKAKPLVDAEDESPQPAAEQQSLSISGHQTANRSVEKRSELKTAIITALITAGIGGGAAVAVAIINKPSDTHPQSAPTTTQSVQSTIPPTPSPPIAAPSIDPNRVPGSITQVAINSGPSGLTVFGRADPGISSVAVLVGPRVDIRLQYWAGQGAVGSNGAWTVVIDTPPSLSFPFKVDAYFSTSGGSSGWVPALGGDPGPHEGVSCAETKGPSCLGAVGLPATYTGVGP